MLLLLETTSADVTIAGATSHHMTNDVTIAGATSHHMTNDVTSVQCIVTADSVMLVVTEGGLTSIDPIWPMRIAITSEGLCEIICFGACCTEF